jgi:hypothetical protein
MVFTTCYVMQRGAKAGHTVGLVLKQCFEVKIEGEALGAIDATLGQTWNILPKSAQEALVTTYSRLGRTPPSQRK